jgi:hypothetical protein
MEFYPLFNKRYKMKNLFTLPIIVLWMLLVGCSSDPSDQALETQSRPTQTQNTIGTIVPTITPTLVRTKEATPTITGTPLSSTTLETTIQITPTATTIIDSVTNIQTQCLIPDPILEDEAEVTAGLILHGTWNGEKGAAILGTSGLEAPLIFIPDLEGQTNWPSESPDNIWLADLNSNKNIQSEELIVWNPFSGEEIRHVFEGISLLPYDASFRWTKDLQLVLPLKNDVELFQWLVWSPFIGKQEILSAELSGIGNHMEYFNVPPSVDPLLELVAYPCEFCDGAEYAVKSIDSGETVWFIDLGEKPSYAYRGPVIWSPDGEFVAIVGGRNSILNGLWIFNRHGELVHEIVLPDIGGIVAASYLAWSPNSEYLAFSRGSYNGEGEIISTLAYVSLADGSVTDLCLDFQTQPHWFSDSTKIAYSQQIQRDEQLRLISIVDIDSGDVVQLNDANAYNLLGWISPPEDG